MLVKLKVVDIYYVTVSVFGLPCVRKLMWILVRRDSQTGVLQVFLNDVLRMFGWKILAFMQLLEKCY